MLRTKVYVNEKEIADIQIVNTKEKTKDGQTIYTVVNGDFEYKVFHNREDGWEVLLHKFLELQINVNESIKNLPLRSLMGSIKI